MIFFIVTADATVTLMVTICVVSTNVSLFGLIHFWGLTINPLVVLNIIVAIGISVDYSAHIAYCFLTTPVPEDGKYNTDRKIRFYKARAALATMGSSVFHGGFSTFLAILVLGAGQTYVFIVFFRIWIGIIVFGMANGFLLLPVMLTLRGPTKTASNPIAGREEERKKVAPMNTSINNDSAAHRGSANFDTAKSNQALNGSDRPLSFVEDDQIMPNEKGKKEQM